MQRKIWSEQEERFIKDNLTSMSLKEFSDYFNIPSSKIQDKIHKMGLSIKRAQNIFWTESENKLLEDNYSYASKHYIESILPNRTWSQIKNHGKWLGLHRISQDRYYINHNFFSEWNEASSYFIGFIMADGHISYGSNKWLSLHIAKKDLCILEKLKMLMQYEGPIKFYKARKSKIGNHISNGSESCELRINNAKIVLDLIDKGIPVDNKTFLADFPSDISKDMIRHFIRGLIDGDGSILIRNYKNRKNKGLSIEIYGTEKIVRGVRDNVNIDCSDIKLCNRSSDHYWMFQINGKRAKAIADWLYNDSTIYLQRKYDKYKEYCNYYNAIK